MSPETLALILENGAVFAIAVFTLWLGREIVKSKLSELINEVSQLKEYAPRVISHLEVISSISELTQTLQRLEEIQKTNVLLVEQHERILSIVKDILIEMREINK